MTYYFKKITTFVLSIFLLSVAVFFVSSFAPGDPLLSYYGDRAEKMTVEERINAKESLGLNKPVYIRYSTWLTNALKGDFGISYKYKEDVLKVIKSRTLNTVILGGISFVIVFILALLVGILCIMYENKFLDRAISKTGTVVSCIPEFFLSLMLILLFSVSFRLLPSGGAYSVGNDSISSRIYHLILPVTSLVLSHLWYYAYMVRNRLSEEVRKDYVLLARAKGLKKSKVLLKHCLRNVMPSYLSLMAISVPHILGGTYIVETVFSYPGIGTLSYESARFKDYNLLMVICILTGITVILCNIIAQIINERIDPRIKHTEVNEND